MGLEFPLAGLLRLRRAIEAHEQAKLQNIVSDLQVAKALFLDIQQSCDRIQGLVSSSLATCVAGADLLLLEANVAAKKKSLRDLEARISELDRAVQVQRLRYHQAHQETEVIESVRQQQLEDYQRESTRKIQRENDDLFLIRSAFRSEG